MPLSCLRNNYRRQYTRPVPEHLNHSTSEKLFQKESVSLRTEICSVAYWFCIFAVTIQFIITFIGSHWTERKQRHADFFFFIMLTDWNARNLARENSECANVVNPAFWPPVVQISPFSFSRCSYIRLSTYWTKEKMTSFTYFFENASVYLKRSRNSLSSTIDNGSDLKTTRRIHLYSALTRWLIVSARRENVN